MIDPTAQVDPSAEVPGSARVWGLAQVRAEARLGERTIVGRGAYVGVGVVIGSDVKIQNNALVYEPAVLEDGVFVGPGATLTNDRHPRAVNPDGTLKAATDWEPVGVTVRRGASVGAGAICVAPVDIGTWAMVAAGSVVVQDVPSHALVAGNPARRIGWVSTAGHRLLKDASGDWLCSVTGEAYREVSADSLVRLESRA